MNVLFTCAGRRNYLIQYFKNALAGDGLVCAADVDLTAPALKDADKAFKVPNVYDTSYVDSILELCAAHNIGMLISLNDLELPVLAAQRERFKSAGVVLLVSDDTVINICADKTQTVQFLQENGFDTPKTYSCLETALQALDAGELLFPLMVKPRWGSASLGLTQVTCREELEWAFKLTSRMVARGPLAQAGTKGDGHQRVSTKLANPDQTVIVQEWIEGSEYGLDVLNNLNQEFQFVYAKRKLGMRAGETDKATMVDDPRLTSIGERLGRCLGHIANLDVDVFLTQDRAVILELNPRFGGGYPFSHELGARYPQALLAWAQGKQFDESVQSRCFDTVVTKCDRMLIVNQE